MPSEGKHTSITRIRNQTGMEVHTQLDIYSKFLHHFEDLYSEHNPATGDEIEAFLDRATLPYILRKPKGRRGDLGLRQK